MIRTQNRIRLCNVLILLILAFIWGNSLMPAEISHAFSQWVKKLLEHILPPQTGIVQEGSGLLRKVAHFAEFSALGFCLTWRRGILHKKISPALLSGAAAAALDETIQIFVPGRGPGITDVLIDSTGVLTGMLLLCLGHTILTKRKPH